jgi:C4-dicarboxylate-specific signal transduction histidine kinase
MTMSRPHPRHGWLWLSRPDWNRTLEQCLRLRDASPDPLASGQPAAYAAWVDDVELPQLAARYRSQFTARVDDRRAELERLERSIADGRLDLTPDAERCRAEIQRLESLL